MRDRTLLVVEDDPLLLESICQMIAITLDLNVAQAVNGLQALEVIRHQPVDMILCDIRMPTMSGIEFASVLRAQGSEIPLIFCSAYGDRENLLAALNLHAFHFIEKPIKPEELFTVLKRASAHTGQDQRRVFARFELSPQQSEILQLVMAGLSNLAIGEKVSLSEPTVKYHVGKLLKRFDASSRAQLKEIVENETKQERLKA